MRCLFAIVAMAASVVFSAAADDRALVRKQFADYFVRVASHESSVRHFLERQRSDGTWKDVDYKSQRRGAWPTLHHLKRVETMAVVYNDADAKLYHSDALRSAVEKGLGHWLEKDYRNANWWYGRIGIPTLLGNILMLMGDALPDEYREQARPILNRSKMGMTGQNKVWCAGIAFQKGLLYGDKELMEKAVAEIWSELRVSTEEGIQPDWSFHQHGPQQQFGNYGSSFAGDMIKWASILRGTDYALAGEKLEILRNYLLEGSSWIVWNGRMDLSGCGRQIDQGAQAGKGRAVIRQLETMKRIDPDHADRYADVLQRIGFNPFWRSEMAVQRRGKWYASVKMSSSRIIGAETCNSENMQGLHLGDGMLLMYQKGDEYEDIVPLWDWKRLPGTTCDQGFEKLVPKSWNRGYGGSDFSGVLGDGETGLAAMIYKRNGLAARKAYFFLQNHIVCLGAGISGGTSGPVYTSVQQSWLKGAVYKYNEWVHHDGIAWQFLSGRPETKAGKVEGNWEPSFPTRGDRPASGEVFSLWIDHGISPHGANYAYRIYPDTSVEQMKKFQGLEKSSVLSNTQTLQAVASGRNVYAVFYEAGVLKIDGNRNLKVNGPCLLQLADRRIIVADPTCSLKTLDISVNGERYVVNLPQGADQGRPVVVQ